jgi:uncharacterized membrane protein YbaN (DUF454 family)
VGGGNYLVSTLRKNQKKPTMKKIVFATFGVISVVLGTIGIVTPVLPTTPFLVLAVYLFSRSSPKMLDFLIKNKVLGKYLSDYFDNKPIPIKQKIYSILFVWLGLGSTFYFADLPHWLVVLLIIIGIAVSAHIATLGRFGRQNRCSE